VGIEPGRLFVIAIYRRWRIGIVELEQRTLLTAKEAAQYLRVSLLTLSKIEKQGGIVPFRTPGGHRRYSLDMLRDYLEQSRQPRYHKVTV
jgi:excisionase family DNA binding protein